MTTPCILSYDRGFLKINISSQCSEGSDVGRQSTLLYKLKYKGIKENPSNYYTNKQLEWPIYKGIKENL
jgi:hypothetical protein